VVDCDDLVGVRDHLLVRCFQELELELEPSREVMIMVMMMVVVAEVDPCANDTEQLKQCRMAL
jgi:hypothetical protein